MAQNLLKYCSSCDVYTLYDECKKCGNKTKVAAPPRFSTQDHYGKYRRMLKKREENK